MKYKNIKIILDGFWGVGKTTYAKSLKNKGWYFVIEPNHRRNNLFKKFKNINDFYILHHLINMKKMELSKKPCVLERSIVSSFAYNYAINNPIWRAILSYIKEDDALFRNVKFYCFFCNFQRFERMIKKYGDNKIIPKGVSPINFYKRFIKAFHIFQKLNSTGTSIIMLNNNKFVSDIFN